jgi:P27 family predicted phage terminase small subunit
MKKKDSVSSFLNPETQVFLDNLTAILRDENILTSLDEDTLRLIINTFDIYAESTRILRKEGLIITSPRGEKKSHPCYKMQHDSGIQLDKLFDRFGLNPEARRELIKPKEKSQRESDIAKFLKKTKGVHAEVQNN